MQKCEKKQSRRGKTFKKRRHEDVKLQNKNSHEGVKLKKKFGDVGVKLYIFLATYALTLNFFSNLGVNLKIF